jgi:5-methylcytosine-specific restriction protein A
MEISKKPNNAWTQKAKDSLMKRNPQKLCANCHESMSSRYDLQLDHIVPKCRGGSDDQSNLQLLCKECHRKKTTKDVEFLNRYRNFENGGGI